MAQVTINGTNYTCVEDDHGKLCFQQSRIVRLLLETSPLDLNAIGLQVQMGMLTTEEYKELYRLLGLAVEDYRDLFPEDDIEVVEEEAEEPELTDAEIYSEVPPTVIQLDMMDGVHIEGLRNQLIDILKQHEAARDDYFLAMFYHWMGYARLGQVLGDRSEPFRAWIAKGKMVKPKTIINVVAGIQKDFRALDANPEVREQRDRQSHFAPY